MATTRCWLVVVVIEVLENIGLLIRGVVTNVLLDSLDLLNQVEFVLLRQLIEVELHFFLRYHCLTINSVLGHFISARLWTTW